MRKFTERVVLIMQDWLNELLPPGTPEGQARAVMCDEDLVTVGAGAGTGKTWVLSARFVRLLLSDTGDKQCLPQNVLTLTFTEAAAREMAERIRARAFKTMAAMPGERESEWQAVKEGFDETWISTIHSFASRLIRESGLSLDIDPHSGVVSAPQEDVFWGTLERVLECLDLSSLASVYGDKFFSEIAQRLEDDAAFISALEKWGPAGLRTLAREVVELHSSAGHSYNTMLEWAGHAEHAAPDPQAAEAFESVLGLLRPKWDEAWNLWRTIFEEMRRDILDARDNALKKQDGTEKKRVSPVISLAGLLERWTELMNAPSGDEVKRAFYLDLCASLSSDASKLFKAIAVRLGQTASKWRDAQEKWAALSDFPGGAEKTPLSAAEQRLRAALLRFSALAWWAWDEMKKRRSLLSFSDMIRFAAQSAGDASKPKGFRYVMIDEFQDTDPLQDAMIRTLREKEGAKLFLVGDPKQAIYRFRHADLTLFADYILKSRKLGSAINLDVSFRTRSSLMDRLNSLFSHIWKNGLGAGRMADIKFEPLTVPASERVQSEQARPERENATVPPFTLLLSARHGREVKPARERLASALSDTIAGFVKEGRTVWDKENKCLRPASWRDIAVLTPTRSEYEILERAFEERAIPASFEKSKSYFSRGEVTDVINVLRAAAFPSDEAALAGWLSSPFSGASQREVLDCLQARASSSCPLCDVMRERLPDAAERLSYLRRAGSLKGPAAVLSLLMDDRRYLAAFDPSQRLRVAANISRAISSARQYERDVSRSLAGCAGWLDSALRSGAPAEEPDTMDENADAVRVMTVHASKGLEFPVVAVMRMERGISGKSNTSIAASRTMGVVLSDVPDMIRDDEAKPRSLLWERALSAQSELEESQRLFYVAATRARDSLILCAAAGDLSTAAGIGDVSPAPGMVLTRVLEAKPAAAGSWLSWVVDWLGTDEGAGLCGESCIVIADESADTSVIEKKRDVKAVPGSEPVSLDLPAMDGMILSSFSATSYALFEWCPFAWRRRHRQGLDLRWEIPDSDEDSGYAGAGAELGSVAHWILSRWDMREDTLCSWLDDEGTASRMPSALRDAWRSGRNKDVLRGWLTAFAASGEGQAMALAAAGGALVREKAFSATLSAQGSLSSTLRLTGAMDVLWGEQGYWHVRDYKITLSDNAPDELYRAQLAFYALVVKVLAEKRGLEKLGVPFDGVDVGLIFLREGGRTDSTRRFSRDADWPAMSERVMTAAAGAAAGPWTPRRDNCRRCPWRVKCPKPNPRR